MDLWDKMKKTMNKGLEVSKDLFGLAGEAARDLGEKGVLKLELKELESRLNAAFRTLGSNVYASLRTEGKATISGKNADVVEMLNLIDDIKHQIRTREAQMEALKKHGNEKSSDEPSDLPPETAMPDESGDSADADPEE